MIASLAASQRDVLQRTPLNTSWEMASSAEVLAHNQLDDLHFIPAKVPGTVASALHAAGAWRPGGDSLDAGEHWFRCRFDSTPAQAHDALTLELDGIATLSEVWLNGRHILNSSSMFTAHRLDVTALIGHKNELLIACRSLLAALRERRGQQPRARWRTRIVGEQQLRWFRTTLLGRAPGFAPEPPPVGPWRPVTLVRRRDIVLERFSREAHLADTTGVITIHLEFKILRADAQPVSGRVWAGQNSETLECRGSGERSTGHAVLRLSNANPWWPHTHGEPFLYPLRAELELKDGTTIAFDDTPVGFRSLEFGNPAFGVNGHSIFCRGVVWTPPDPVAFAAVEPAVRKRLELLRGAGFNMIRLAGTTAYEDDTFHRLCDELGLLVWQDMMFANMDYPFSDPVFWDTACREVESYLTRLGRHPSSAMICGNSEIEQQVAMLGMDPALGRGPFFADQLPRLVERCCPGVPYLPSAPCGGNLPFHSRSGVANYFGVGAYLRPLEDARRAQVRFASECLAFANVPEPEMIERLALATAGGISPLHPTWKRAVPRDAGAGWDFEDVRDHYLKLLYSTDPLTLRYSDPRRYWELSPVVSGEVMQEVFAEWRRSDSGCGGGIILWSADLLAGAGWGILDSEGNPKAAYWYLKRILSPCAVWTTDEGLNGVDIHLANDTSLPRELWLRVALYADGEHKVHEAARPITLSGRGTATFGVEELLGRFVDSSYSYRFGPPRHDLIVASLHLRPEAPPFAQSFRLPLGRPAQRLPISELCIASHAHCQPDGSIEVLLTCNRFAYGVRIAAENAVPDDCYFNLEPGCPRRIVLAPRVPGNVVTDITITAINADGRIAVSSEATV